jgi:hypothetical protein
MIRLSMTEEHPTDEYGQMGLFPAEFKVGDKVWWNGDYALSEIDSNGNTIKINHICSDKIMHPEKYPILVEIINVMDIIVSLIPEVKMQAFSVNVPAKWWVWPETLSFYK